MSFFANLWKRLFARTHEQVAQSPPIEVEDDDPLTREIIAKVWETGKAHIGIRHDDGSVEIRPFGPDN
jgi:hypothetical protein